MTTNKTALPLDVALIQRVEALQSTAEYLECLLEISRETARGLSKFLSDNVVGKIDSLGDWRTIETLLSLASTQVDIVRATALEVELAAMAAHRPAPPRPAGFAPFTGIAA